MLGSCCIVISIPGTNISENYSLTNDNSDSILFHSTTVTVCVLCLLLPIPIFAIMGNLFIMAAAAHFQSLHAPTNALVVSLAVADFLVAVLVIRLGCIFCQVHFMLDLTLCTPSIFNLKTCGHSAGIRLWSSPSFASPSACTPRHLLLC